MEIASILITSAVTIVEKMISSWINKKVTSIQVKDINKELSKLASIEAEKLRLRNKDLEAESIRLWTIISKEMPEIKIDKRSFARDKCTLLYNPEIKSSGHALMSKLKLRLDELGTEYKIIYHSECTPIIKPDIASKFVPVKKLTNIESFTMNNDFKVSKSQEMINDLKKRIVERENS